MSGNLPYRSWEGAAITVLALGIGANATVFSALRMVILEPAAFPEPDRIAFVHLTQEHLGRGSSRLTTWSFLHECAAYDPPA